ncbi:unnamed protein product [Rhizophagus irregularis]|nr:unnamed protein product [Rhizophagus irregularis]
MKLDFKDASLDTKPDFKRKIRLLSSNTDSMEMSVSSALELGSVLSALGLGYADMASERYLAVDQRLGMNWYHIGKLRFLGLEIIGSSLRFLGFGIGYMGFRSLRIWIQNFSYGFISTAALDSNFLFVSCFDSTADFICCAANLEQLDNRLEFSFDWTILWEV